MRDGEECDECVGFDVDLDIGIDVDVDVFFGIMGSNLDGARDCTAGRDADRDAGTRAEALLLLVLILLFAPVDNCEATPLELCARDTTRLETNGSDAPCLVPGMTPGVVAGVVAGVVIEVSGVVLVCNGRCCRSRILCKPTEPMGDGDDDDGDGMRRTRAVTGDDDDGDCDGIGRWRGITVYKSKTVFSDGALSEGRNGSLSKALVWLMSPAPAPVLALESLYQLGYSALCAGT